MSPKITVVARANNDGTWLANLVRSLDEQTLAYDEFETVFLVPDRAAPVGQRLAHLARRRPNVSVRSGIDATGLASEVNGTWILDLGADAEARRVILFPEALARLVEFGSAHSLDALLGRTVLTDRWLVNDLFLADRPRIEPEAVDSGGAEGVLAVRRDRAATASTVNEVRATGGAVGILGGYPVAKTSSVGAPPDVAQVAVLSSALEWREGRLRMAVEVAADSTRTADRVALTLTHLPSRFQLHLPARTEGRTAGRLSAEAEIDIMTAAGGQRLTDGVWKVHVGLHGSSSRWQELAPIPRSGLGPAIVDGIRIAPSGGNSGLTLDIGAQSTSVIGTVAATAVQLVETAKGTLLSASLEHIAAMGDSRTPCSLVLDAFPLPAYLVAEHGRARLECFVSGLAGTSRLSTQFGDGERTPTGLTLVIAPTGTMTVTKTPVTAPKAKAPAPTPAPPAAGRAANLRKAVPLGQRLRRAVPRSLEPTVQRMSRGRIARRVYRAAIGLPRSDRPAKR